MLRLIDRELGLGLGAAGCRAVLDHQDRMERDGELKAAQKAVRESTDVVTKIELLVGADALRTGLPEGLMEAELHSTDGVEPTGRRIAQMAFNAHGDGVLQQHARDIQGRFPNAPVAYGGSPAAIAFVSELRLPVAFAGSRTPSPRRSRPSRALGTSRVSTSTRRTWSGTSPPCSTDWHPSAACCRCRPAPARPGSPPRPRSAG